LFVDRAGRAEMHFTLDGQTGPDVARLVTRLDGMPLAIELAAARVEALGVSQLLGRLDDRFALLAGGDRLAPSRQRSLAATVEWSYQLLDERERRAFRAVSVFPGPFTLEGAEAVAGTDAGPAVLRLVDCSLLAPPRTGVDGRPRYIMLETLRAYGAKLRGQAGEQDEAAALAGYALRLAEDAAAGLRTAAGEVAAARWLDAEDATTRQVLAWAIKHDAPIARRLADALGWWWWLRGRLAGQYRLLREVAASAEAASEGWCAVQSWLGWAAYFSADESAALGHFTAVLDAVGARGASRVLADALAGKAVVLLNTGRLAEGTQDARRSLAMARELGYRTGEGIALGKLAIAASYSGDHDGAIRLIRQQEQFMADIPGSVARGGSLLITGALIDAGDLPAAETVCAAVLARCRDAGDAAYLPTVLMDMAGLDMEAGRIQDAAPHLREGLQAALRTGNWKDVASNGLWHCALLCTATGRYAEAATAWAAHAAHAHVVGGGGGAPADMRMREEALSKARQALGPDRTRAAEERGAAMSMDIAAEYALMLTAPGSRKPQALAGLGSLSARERELVTLVAQGRTDAQIAAQLYISIRTVRSHLDRIRDKTGCRRRADLTRLALAEGLV
jgi:DNA-binding CsgD family transcriptional regulator